MTRPGSAACGAAARPMSVRLSCSPAPDTDCRRLPTSIAPVTGIWVAGLLALKSSRPSSNSRLWGDVHAGEQTVLPVSYRSVAQYVLAPCRNGGRSRLSASTSKLTTFSPPHFDGVASRNHAGSCERGKSNWRTVARPGRLIMPRRQMKSHRRPVSSRRRPHKEVGSNGFQSAVPHSRSHRRRGGGDEQTFPESGRKTAAVRRPQNHRRPRKPATSLPVGHGRCSQMQREAVC